MAKGLVFEVNFSLALVSLARDEQCLTARRAAGTVWVSLTEGPPHEHRDKGRQPN